MGKGLILGRAPTDAQWQVFADRAPATVIYAVASTGIYCRAGCPARMPLRRNVSLFDSREGAEAAGFRACKRCWRD